jgi:dihydrofolate reductase
MLIRTHVGVSLDGFMATPAGLPTWDLMPTFGAGSHGYAELMEQCGAVIVGRTSFDQGFEDWLKGWPWPGKPVYVLTSRPLPETAAEMGVVASQGGPVGIVAQVRASGLEKDVQLLGGPSTVRAFLEAGALDRLGMVVLPVLLGTGIPLFATEPTAFSQEAWTASLAAPAATNPRSRLVLEHQQAFPDGAIHLVYRPESRRDR